MFHLFCVRWYMVFYRKMLWKCRPYSRIVLLFFVIILFVCVIFLGSLFIVDDDDHRIYEPIPMKLANVRQCYRQPNTVDAVDPNAADAAAAGVGDKTAFKPSLSENNSGGDSIRYFEDILDSKWQPTPGKTIFFHETSCSKTGIIELNAKQACAIESAARLHPNHDIVVLFASPVGLKHNDIIPQNYKYLKSFKNIHWHTVNLWRYANGTKLHEWLMTDELFHSSFVFEHMSDIVRALSLYRYGGYHMDLDVIVLKNMDELGENFIGDDWADVINAAVMHINNHGIGRQVIELFFNEVINSFNGSSFIANGPRMLTRVFQEICESDDRTLWTYEQCNGLRIQPKETFYPISWTDFMLYFDPKNLNEALDMTRNATVIHVWNDRSKSIWNPVGTKNAYQFLAEKKCPQIYRSSEYF